MDVPEFERSDETSSESGVESSSDELEFPRGTAESERGLSPTKVCLGMDDRTAG